MDTTPVKVYWNPVESGRVWWSLVEPGRVHWSESSGLHQTQSRLSPVESGGIHGLWWTPADSIWTRHPKLAHVTPTQSRI